MTAENDAPAEQGARRPGEVISGRYRIQKVLGEGGMGAVYLAEHTLMKKLVAMKLLHPEMSDNAEVIARFEREAMAAARIQHPNVVAATDCGKTDDGAFFLVLEYIEGTSLRDVLEAGPMPAHRTLRIARQIALALERAHEAGIVHRDLKPENVMLVQREGDPDFVKVLDFGIAKLSAEAAPAAAAQPLTRLGTVLGTPEYMAPEQALGAAVTPPSDLYAVGVMLYEMLTGKHPFSPPDRVAMLSFHIVAPVPTMRDRAPDVDVPPAIEAVVRRLLEKDAKARHPNARELIEALEAAAAASALGDLASPQDEASKAPPPSQREAWRAGDAFAKTSIGGESTAAPSLTSPVAVTPPPPSAQLAPPPSATAETLASKLSRQPRGVLIGLAAAVPLALVLVVTLVVLGLRGAKVGEPGGDASTTNAPAPRTKAAPADRLTAAVALGPEAIEALGAEFPDDPAIKKQLAIAYHANDRGADAMKAVTVLLETDKAATNDEEILKIVVATASKGAGDDDAFAILEGRLGAAGVDALVDLSSKGPTREIRLRAAKSLTKPEVRANASPATAILLDFKGADSCTAKRDLLDRAKEHGDARLLASLRPLVSTRGCRKFLSRVDCWPCLRKDSALGDAIGAIEARNAKN
ncbi:MAG: protein kinase [Labilithrix sp.]|nr:protein kinase [Labilithrix sp.]